MDNTQAQLNVDSVNTGVYAQNPYEPDADWSVAAFDIRHVFAANMTWEVPGVASSALLSGWQINSIVSLRSGLPFSPSIATPNWSRDGNTSGEDRPNVMPGVDQGSLITGDPNRWFDTSAFTLQPAGTLGNTPRDFLRGPGFANVDLSLVKNQAVAGGTKLQLRLEIFNLFNRANFAVHKGNAHTSDTLSPDARNGIVCVPRGKDPCASKASVPISSRIRPYLAFFPIANGAITGDTARYNFAGQRIGLEPARTSSTRSTSPRSTRSRPTCPSVFSRGCRRASIRCRA